MYVKRTIEKHVKDLLSGWNKVVTIMGARQVGKTSMARQVIESLGLKTLSINADDFRYHSYFNPVSLDALSNFVGDNQLFVIDEAQRLPNIGLNIKLLHDSMPNLKIMLTGSSSFDIASEVSEHLTGRKIAYDLFPLSFAEASDGKNEVEMEGIKEHFLVYGSYPEVFVTKNNDYKIALLYEIAGSYLYKDILHLTTVKYTAKLRDLLRLLALQIGNEVSIHELSNALNISSETVERYLDLLQKSFVIFSLEAYSTNQRKEISKQKKYFFYDLGIRNALIENFSPMDMRPDKGNLWENFLIAERLKFLRNNGQKRHLFFWRAYNTKEIDLVEVKGREIFAFEMKLNRNKAKAPKIWREAYPEATFELINSKNYKNFIL